MLDLIVYEAGKKILDTDIYDDETLFEKVLGISWNDSLEIIVKDEGGVRWYVNNPKDYVRLINTLNK